ncbi:HNH endonuclease signature motif containing protein [Agromyces bauzanensis]|uniref:HNH nuclease domain-containing protein n=1 Tax=Agromyces bauzanensis TaxID=1308924 RepID=A0A917P9M8_9MICO|nr:HNH endonuclease signature motif containing protein [Agromyces bauzanensis]GGJ67752.1 hypothetical protein GCM10011372_01920 [Agromyces bauzanensis]
MEPTARLAEALDRVTELERSIRSLQAEQLRRVRELRLLMRTVEAHPARTERDNREWADRACSAELATSLQVHERTATAMMHDASALVDLPATAEALAVGDVSLHHVRALIDAVGFVPRERATEFEQEAIEKARRMTTTGFRRALVRMQHRYRPTAAEARKRRALDERRLVIEPAHDGMTWVNLLCAAEEAVAIRARVASAVAVRQAGDVRTRPQREADAAVGLLLGRADAAAVPEPGDLGTVRATVHLVIPALTLLGHGAQPVMLENYGPIDTETARHLFAHVPSFRTILTDPVSGATLRYGRSTRRVPADLAAWLRIRDGRCRFPGCARPASESDLDHTVASEHDGCTDHDNLSALCRGHHRLKHHTGWRVWQRSDGTIRWHSPAGRWYDLPPDGLVRPLGRPGEDEAAERTG